MHVCITTHRSGAHTPVGINPSILPMMVEEPLFASEVLLVQGSMSNDRLFLGGGSKLLS